METKRNIWTNAFQGLIWIVVGIILDFLIQMFGISGSQGLAMSFGQPTEGGFAICMMLLIVAVLGVVTYWTLMYAIHQVSPKVGLHPYNQEKAKWIWYGYGLVILGSMAVGMLRVFITGDASQAENQRMLEELASQGPFGLIFIILLAVCVSPIIEELIFRGVVLNYFFKNSWWWTNVILSAVLFGYFHVYSAFNFFDFLQYSLMGLILAFVYKRTRQIQYAMALHFVNNAISMIVMSLSLFLS